MNARCPGDAPPGRQAERDRHGRPAARSLHLDLAGTATDDKGVKEVRLILKDARHQPLPPGQRHAGRGVRDLARPTLAHARRDQHDVDAPGRPATRGQLERHGVRLRHRRTSRTPRRRAPRRATRSTPVTCRPTLTDGLLAPTEGAAFTDGRILVSGRAEDDQAIARGGGRDHGQRRPVPRPRPARSRAPRELAHGVPDQPGHAGVELLLHHAGRARGQPTR